MEGYTAENVLEEIEKAEEAKQKLIKIIREDKKDALKECVEESQIL